MNLDGIGLIRSAIRKRREYFEEEAKEVRMNQESYDKFVGIDKIDGMPIIIDNDIHDGDFLIIIKT